MPADRAVWLLHRFDVRSPGVAQTMRRAWARVGTACSPGEIGQCQTPGLKQDEPAPTRANRKPWEFTSRLVENCARISRIEVRGPAGGRHDRVAFTIWPSCRQGKITPGRRCLGPEVQPSAEQQVEGVMGARDRPIDFRTLPDISTVLTDTL
jgi:hypothetical protein